LAWLLTFLGVVIGWVFFRANDFTSAVTILQGMSGNNGIALPNAIMARLGVLGEWLSSMGMGTYLGGGSQFMFTYLWIIPLLTIALFLPNTQQIMSRFEPALAIYPSDENTEIRGFPTLTSRASWQPTFAWSLGIGIVTAFGILALSSVSEFLYFQF